MRRYIYSSCLLSLLLLSGCQSNDLDLELELKLSFKNFLAALERRQESDLRIVVNLPGLTEYKDHVDKLFLKYLEQVETGQVEFDEQGIVLSRFLSLAYYQYSVLSKEKSENGMRANMRIAIKFSYDANIKQANFQKGTKIFIPTSPFGSAETIIIGSDNPVPREQLNAIELDVFFKKINYEGLWQVTKVDVVPNSAKFVTSIENYYSAD